MDLTRSTVLLVLQLLLLAGVASGRFMCTRPTTPCDKWYGRCQPDGTCSCSNGFRGFTCNIPNTVTINGPICSVYNPCQHGTCYDQNQVAKCDCHDGWYGTQCEMPMVQVTCDMYTMEVNIMPYGYEANAWRSPPPLTGKGYTCGLDDVSTFQHKNPTHRSRGWQGFAGIFKHKHDTCAGNPEIISNTPTQVTFGRTVYVSYGSRGPDPTDQTLHLTCDVRRPTYVPPPPMLDPPKVKITFMTPQGHIMGGPIKLGAKIYVHFDLNVPNIGGYDDAQVEMCALRDTTTKQIIAVVDNACAHPPAGELLYKKGPGRAVLIMTVYRLSGMTQNLSFGCQVRVCKQRTDPNCTAPKFCLHRPSPRGKRSVFDAMQFPAANYVDVTKSIDGNYLTVESNVTVTVP